jgi:ElaB/YqjD/DUF883 family membrane-anchored ribosome-binding protein
METYFENLSAKEGSTRRLAQDLRVLLRDTESALTATVGDLADRSKEDLKARYDRLKAAYDRLEDATSAGARCADRLIREKPKRAVGIAFGVGVLLGVALSGRRG